MPPTLEPPYEGSLCCLKIGSRWIPTNVPAEVLWAHQTRSSWDYCRMKYGWDQTTMGSIHWDAIRNARVNMTRTKFTMTSKLMHRWLPVMHMHGHTTGVTTCPGCGANDELLITSFLALTRGLFTVEPPRLQNSGHHVESSTSRSNSLQACLNMLNTRTSTQNDVLRHLS
jgi:hypothetical protein